MAVSHSTAEVTKTRPGKIGTEVARSLESCMAKWRRRIAAIMVKLATKMTKAMAIRWRRPRFSEWRIVIERPRTTDVSFAEYIIIKDAIILSKSEAKCSEKLMTEGVTDDPNTQKSGPIVLQSSDDSQENHRIKELTTAD